MAATDMDSMADRFADRGVTSVFVYTREAHPAENYPHHQSLEDKRRMARAFRDRCGVKRPILLDDLEGTAHRAYGILPNMTWIVAPGGLIFYKASWTVPRDIEAALESALDHWAKRRSQRLTTVFTERLASRPHRPEAFRAGLERNGPQAVQDFYGPDASG